MNSHADLPDSRIQAARERRMFYRSAPCPQGHDGTRYTSNGSCVQCAKDKAATLHQHVKSLLAGEPDAQP